ncbi:MAG: hypothetical protein AAGA77_20005 [Bacteroidota bacterium]
MKYQKSSAPYLILLFAVLFGLPVLDYNMESDLVLEYEIQPAKSNDYEFTPSNEILITHTLGSSEEHSIIGIKR